MRIDFAKFTSNLPVIFGLIVGLCFVTFGVLGFDLGFLPGDLGDTRLNIYFLEHAHQYFFTDNVPTEGYWNAPFIFPQEAIITFSDNLLGTFFIYSLFRFLGCDIYLAFQCWMVVVTILNYLFAYVFVKQVLKNKFAAVLGAFIFAFSIALVEQYAHPQTFPRFCIPIALFFAVRFYKSFAVQEFFLMSLFVVYQIYCVVYLGFMLAVPLAIFLIFAIGLNWKRFVLKLNLNYLLLVVGSLIINLLILLPLVIPYMNSPVKFRPNGDVVYRKYEEVFNSIPTLQSYLFVNRDTFMWNSLNYVGMNIENWWDHQLFIGISCFMSVFFLLLFAIKKIAEKRYFPKIFLALGLSALITFLLYIRVDEFSFYSYVFNLPGFSAVRALHRVINIQLIFFGLFVAITFHILFNGVKNKWPIFILVFSFIVADNFIYGSGQIRFNKKEAKQRIEPLRLKMQGIDFGTIVSYEQVALDERKIFHHVDAMLVAQEFGLKLINGYTSDVPSGYYHFAVGFNEEGRKLWINKTNLAEKIVVVNDVYNTEIQEIIEKIKNSTTWFEQIKNQAISRNISLEESIIRNAIWVYEENKKKKLD
jgi:hypothetical protein